MGDLFSGENILDGFLGRILHRTSNPRGKDNSRFTLGNAVAALVVAPVFDVDAIFAVFDVFFSYLAAVITGIAVHDKAAELNGVFP